MNERSLAPEQQAILSLLNQGERYRYEFVDTVGIGYSRLAETLNPLIQQRLVTYYFEPDGAQRFKLTPSGQTLAPASTASAPAPSRFTAWLRS